jgi:hypothetical protein
MKLWVFNDYYTDYTPGLAVVVANTEEEAYSLLFETYEYQEPYSGPTDINWRAQVGDCVSHEIEYGLVFEQMGGS